MKSLKSLNNKISNKIVIIRLDLNVPILNSKIQDTNRIDKIINTLNYLIKQKSKILIVSHVGRPKGMERIELSLKPICEYLSIKLEKNVKLVSNNLKSLKKDYLNDIFDNNILTLENIRFYKEEETNDRNFAKHLANLGDYYVNEAFSCSHRSHASVSAITSFIDSYAGFLLEKEINALKKLTTRIDKPLTCIIGGSKISTKIKIIEHLLPKFDNLIIVGGMANNFFQYRKYQIGKSIYEEDSNKIVKNILDLGKKYGCNIYIPEDVKVAYDKNDKGKEKPVSQVTINESIFDIGLQTIKKIDKILDNSKTVLWNGPAGYFENPNFLDGSLRIANLISEKTLSGKLYSVIGGGDTVAVINKDKLFKNYNFVSTAGGAFLEYLEGKDLPGIKALN